LERENLAFKNGVFFVDLEKLDWEAIIRKLSNELNLATTTK
jgi:hypothetical protein